MHASSDGASPGSVKANPCLVLSLTGLRQQGTTLTGTLITHIGDLPLSNGTVRGNDFSFVMKMDMPGQMEIPFTGKKVGGEIELTAQPPGGMLELLTNPEVIAIDQDPPGKQARRVSQQGKLEVWARPLADGRVAAALFNRGNERASVTARWTDLGVKGKARVRDAWARKDLGSFADAFTAEVDPHGVALVVLKGR